jgi:hypothetical protein
MLSTVHHKDCDAAQINPAIIKEQPNPVMGNPNFAAGVKTMDKLFDVKPANVFANPVDTSLLKGGSTKDHFFMQFCVLTEMKKMDNVGVWHSMSYDRANVEVEVELAAALGNDQAIIAVKTESVYNVNDKYDSPYNVNAYVCDHTKSYAQDTSPKGHNTMLRLCIETDDPEVEIFDVDWLSLLQKNTMITMPIASFSKKDYKTTVTFPTKNGRKIAFIETQLETKFFLDGVQQIQDSIEANGRVVLEFTRRLLRRMDEDETSTKIAGGKDFSLVVPLTEDDDGGASVAWTGRLAVLSAFAILLLS